MTVEPQAPLLRELLDVMQGLTGVLRTMTTDAAHPGAVGIQLDTLDARIGRLASRLALAPESEAAAASVLPVRELVVERLTVVEPGGTPRLVLCGRTTAPDVIMDGAVIAARQGGNAAGLYFYNDDGDECGAIAYGGGGPDGRSGAGGGLFFDRYKQDQVLFLEYSERPDGQRSGLNVWDRPAVPLPEQLARIAPALTLPEGQERTAAVEALWAAGLSAAPRVFVGRDEQGTALVELRDGRGRPRLRLSVDADGAAAITILDEHGHAIGGAGS